MLEWPLSMTIISNFLLHLAKSWYVVTQITFLLRRFASFELPKSSVCYVINVSQTTAWIIWLVEIYFWIKKKKVINYSCASCVEKLTFPCRSTNKGKTIYKATYHSSFLGNYTDLSLHCCSKTNVFPPQCHYYLPLSPSSASLYPTHSAL